MVVEGRAEHFPIFFKYSFWLESGGKHATKKYILEKAHSPENLAPGSSTNGWIGDCGTRFHPAADQSERGVAEASAFMNHNSVRYSKIAVRSGRQGSKERKMIQEGVTLFVSGSQNIRRNQRGSKN